LVGTRFEDSEERQKEALLSGGGRRLRIESGDERSLETGDVGEIVEAGESMRREGAACALAGEGLRRKERSRIAFVGNLGRCLRKEHWWMLEQLAEIGGRCAGARNIKLIVPRKFLRESRMRRMHLRRLPSSDQGYWTSPKYMQEKSSAFEPLQKPMQRHGRERKVGRDATRVRSRR
jgi:hypothetical protein